jgi:hypothetical protein
MRAFPLRIKLPNVMPVARMKPIRANIVGPPSSTTSFYCRLPFRLVLRRLWQAGDILARIPQGRQLDAGNLYRIIERPPPAAIGNYGDCALNFACGG